ncbi:hypothetical protein ACOSQ2_023488 [Xanthoceras sorbifolium]
MQSKVVAGKGKTKVGEPSKKPRRQVPKFNRGILIPDDFQQGPPSPKRSATKSTQTRLLLWMSNLWLQFMRRRARRKLNNNDRMKLAAFHTWTMGGFPFDIPATELGKKAAEYKQKVKSDHEIICRLKSELPDRGVDRWLKSDEFINMARVEYERRAKETRYLISKVDPSFDFGKLKAIRSEELAKNRTEPPTEGTAEDDRPEDSLDKANIVDSDYDAAVEVN